MLRNTHTHTHTHIYVYITINPTCMQSVGDECPVELRAFGAAARTTYVETGKAFSTFGTTYAEELMLTVGEKGRQKVRSVCVCLCVCTLCMCENKDTLCVYV